MPPSEARLLPGFTRLPVPSEGGAEQLRRRARRRVFYYKKHTISIFLCRAEQVR